MNFFKYCPHCGSTRIKFPNERKFECPDCGFVYFHNVAAAVAVIIEKESKILFTVRNRDPKKGMLDLPGGFNDPGESLEETCSRELEEELNLKISPSQFQYFSSEPNDYKYKDIPYKTADSVFLAKLPKETEFIIEKEEIEAIKWINKSKINLEKIAFDSLRKIVETYLKGH